MLTIDQTASTSGLLLGAREITGSHGKTSLSATGGWGWWDDGDGDDWGDADGWDGDGWDGWDGDF